LGTLNYKNLGGGIAKKLNHARLFKAQKYAFRK